jgi:hypothetical protein
MAMESGQVQEVGLAPANFCLTNYGHPMPGLRRLRRASVHTVILVCVPSRCRAGTTMDAAMGAPGALLSLYMTVWRALDDMDALDIEWSEVKATLALVRRAGSRETVGPRQ